MIKMLRIAYWIGIVLDAVAFVQMAFPPARTQDARVDDRGGAGIRLFPSSSARGPDALLVRCSSIGRIVSRWSAAGDPPDE
jgi:hypothetical protein